MKPRTLLSMFAIVLAGCPAVLKDDYVIVEPNTTDAAADVVDDGVSTGADVETDARADTEVDTGSDAGIADGGADVATCGPCGNGRTCVSGACTPAWVTMAAPPSSFAPRQHSAYCAMGSKVFIWGGARTTSGSELNDGQIYDPATDTWTAVAATNAPSARIDAIAVWTGTVVVVWGGGDLASTTDYNTGALFNPTTNTWTAMSSASSARRKAFAFWTGSKVLVYGGEQKNGNPSGNAVLYDPVADSWSNAAGGGAPAAALSPSVAWSGASLLVYGGTAGANDVATLYSYTPSTNTWASLTAGPAGRHAAFGAYDGSSLVVWGGVNGTSLKSDGARYSGAGGTWTTLGTSGAPTPRQAPNRISGWAADIASGVALLVGGQGLTSTDFKKDGAIYSASTDAWTAVPAWPSGADHQAAAAVWTGTEMVIWGGLNAGAAIATGERYKP